MVENFHKGTENQLDKQINSIENQLLDHIL